MVEYEISKGGETKMRSQFTIGRGQRSGILTVSSSDGEFLQGLGYYRSGENQNFRMHVQVGKSRLDADLAAQFQELRESFDGQFQMVRFRVTPRVLITPSTYLMSLGLLSSQEAVAYPWSLDGLEEDLGELKLEEESEEQLTFSGEQGLKLVFEVKSGILREQFYPTDERRLLLTKVDVLENFDEEVPKLEGELAQNGDLSQLIRQSFIKSARSLIKAQIDRLIGIDEAVAFEEKLGDVQGRLFDHYSRLVLEGSPVADPLDFAPTAEAFASVAIKAYKETLSKKGKWDEIKALEGEQRDKVVETLSRKGAMETISTLLPRLAKQVGGDLSIFGVTVKDFAPADQAKAQEIIYALSSAIMAPVLGDEMARSFEEALEE